MANLSNINNKFLFTDGDFLKIGNLAPINNISSTESGISVTNSNVASITLDNTAANGKRHVMYSSGNGSLVFWDSDAASARLQIDSSGMATFSGRVNAGESFGALKDGADTVADGPFFRLTNAATTRQYLFQLDASNNIDYWYYNGSTWTQTISLLTNGGATFAGSISATSTSNTLTLYNNANNDAFRVFRGSLQTLSLWTATNGTILSLSSDTVAGSITLDSRANQDSYINTGGNVGIGTTSPGYKLNVINDNTATWTARFTNNTNNVYLSVNDANNYGIYVSGETKNYFSGNIGIGTTSPQDKLNLHTSSASGNIGMKITRGTETHGLRLGVNSSHAFLWTTEAQNLVFATSGIQRISILSGGNVGIGVTGPTYKLQVAGTTLISGGLKVIGPGSYNTFQSGNDYTLGLNDYNSVSQWWLKAYTTGDFALHENTQGDRFTIKAGGNVGIGTTSPTAKLDIAGDVRYQGDTYSEFTYNGSGNYSNGTIYTIASTGQLTVNGIYQIVMYLDDFGAGGGTYFCWFCSVPFYWVTTGTNRIVSQNLPALIGTGHAIGTIPTFTITQEMGTSGGQAKIRFNPQNNWTNINGTSGRKFVVYVKRLGG